MQDRTPTYPGRVTLTPVIGQTDTYDMQMADEPTQAGTPPVKANLLSDDAAALVWRGSPPLGPTVSLALSELATENAKMSTGGYTGTGTYGAGSPNTLSFDFEPKLVFITGHRSTGADSNYIETALLIRPFTMYTANLVASGIALGSVGWDGKSVSWHSETNAHNQSNVSGRQYEYIAFG